MGTNTGVNLLKPGTNPKTNLRFLTFFVNTIAAIHRHADVLRAAIASAGNDHRLGANEAPPAIISAFIGSKLTELLDAVEKNVSAGKMSPDEKTAVKARNRSHSRGVVGQHRPQPDFAFRLHRQQV